MKYKQKILNEQINLLKRAKDIIFDERTKQGIQRHIDALTLRQEAYTMEKYGVR